MIDREHSIVLATDRQSALACAPDNGAGIGVGVYESLARHQREEDWAQRDRLRFLQDWAKRFDVEFELHIAELTLAVGALPVSRLGQFRYGHNDVGLKGEVSLNSRYVDGMPDWEVLGVLLHELLHAWQQAHGTPGRRNHHNTEFREKAASFGLIVDKQGVMGYAAESPFKDLLRGHGIETPREKSVPQERRKRGASKMKKWSCSCPVNVRCAVELKAKCLQCNRDFQVENAHSAAEPRREE